LSAYKRHLVIVASVMMSLARFPLDGESVLAQPWHAMDWVDGSSPASTDEWARKMGVDWERLSCKVSSRRKPQACIDYVKKSPRPNINKYFLYISVDDPSTLQDDALEYSQASLDTPQIEEVGIDDFFSSYYSWYKDRSIKNPAEFLGKFIDNLKSENPNLKFGITLYEDELDPVAYTYINDAHLPPDIKKKFDYIHLFLHYRMNGPRFAQYVDMAQAMFPNAKIIAGVYAYDRIDYFPCSQDDYSKRSCKQQEEFDLFNQALSLEMQLLKEGKVVGLELYPGYFGAEDKLDYGPRKNQLTCKTKRLMQCVLNTQAMRDRILAQRNKYLNNP